MATMFNPSADIPDFESQGIENIRQQKLADALRKIANESAAKTGPGQMVGSGYVSTSPWQYLANMVQGANASQAENAAAKAQAATQMAMSKDAANWRSSLPQATAAIPGSAAIPAAPNAEGESIGPAVPATPGAPAQPVTLQQAMAHYMKGQNNPLLANESQSYLKMAGMDAEQRDRLAQAKALRESTEVLEREKLAQGGEIAREKIADQKRHDKETISARGEIAKDAAQLRRDLHADRAPQRERFQLITDAGTGEVQRVNLDTGEVSKITGAGKGARPLPSALSKDLSTLEDHAATMGQMVSTFKPGFGGTSGALKETLGAYVPGMSDDAAQWWKTYRKQSELADRNKMFGASLTKEENAAWKASDISPGMKPETIQKNLAIREKLAAKSLANSVDRAAKGGYPSVLEIYKPSVIRDTGIGGGAEGEQSPGAAPVKVTNAADYAKVPSGGTYTDPSGQVRTKP